MKVILLISFKFTCAQSRVGDLRWNVIVVGLIRES